MDEHDKQSLTKLYQQNKGDIALLRRNGLTWPFILPLSIHQTLFPSIFQEEHRK